MIHFIVFVGSATLVEESHMIEIGSSDCKFEDEIRPTVKLTRHRHGYVDGGGINQHWVEVDPKDGNNIGF